MRGGCQIHSGVKQTLSAQSFCSCLPCSLVKRGRKVRYLFTPESISSDDKIILEGVVTPEPVRGRHILLKFKKKKPLNVKKKNRGDRGKYWEELEIDSVVGRCF